MAEAFCRYELRELREIDGGLVESEDARADRRPAFHGFLLLGGKRTEAIRQIVAFHRHAPTGSRARDPPEVLCRFVCGGACEQGFEQGARDLAWAPRPSGRAEEPQEDRQAEAPAPPMERRLARTARAGKKAVASGRADHRRRSKRAS